MTALEWIGIVSNWSESYTTWCIIQRLFAIVNLMHCLSWFLQIEGLMGDEGIDPIKDQLQRYQKTAESNYIDTLDEAELAGLSILSSKYQYDFLKFRFLSYPTLFWISTKTIFLKGVCLLGIIASLFIIFGLHFFQANFAIGVVLLWWTCCLVNSSISQVSTVFALQTESMMIESTFLFGLSNGFSINLYTPLLSLLYSCVSSSYLPFIDGNQIENLQNNLHNFQEFIGDFPNVPIILFRWLAFRIMLSAGLVKWFGSDHWRKLSAMNVHYQTQPLPNPLSRFFYQLPTNVHKLETLLSLIIEGPICLTAILIPHSYSRYFSCICFVGLMMMINVSGIYAYLGILTSVICCSFLDDHFFNLFLSDQISPDYLSNLLSAQSPSYYFYTSSFLSYFPLLINFAILLFFTTVVILYVGLTYFTIMYVGKKLKLVPQFFVNLFMEIQHTNLVHVIGFFANMTTYRWEVILEGSADGENWKRFDFYFKITDPNQKPSWNRFYLWPRLDWHLWMVPLRVRPFLDVVDGPVLYPPWLDRFMGQILKQNPAVVSLLKQPFFNMDGKPTHSRHLRMFLYDYRFALTDKLQRENVAAEAIKEITQIIKGEDENSQNTKSQSGLITVSRVPKQKNIEETNQRIASLHQTIGDWWIETGPVTPLAQMSLKDD